VIKKRVNQSGSKILWQPLGLGKGKALEIFNENIQSYKISGKKQ
jgi:hypothetical protein